MASRLTRNTLCQAKRGLSTQPVVQKTYNSPKVQTSKIASGLTVASIDSGSSISTVGVVCKAGPRNESYDNLGVNQAIRLASGFATKKATNFGNDRNIAHVGGKVDVSCNREHTFYQVQASRNKIEFVAELVLAMVDGPLFKPYEITSGNPMFARRMSDEINNLTLAELATDLLHQAAYRDGLGNSLYAPKYMVGKYTPAMMREFHEKYYTMERSVLVGIDIDHENLVALGENLSLPKGKTATTPAKYAGGLTSRQATSGDVTTIAVAAEVAGWSNVKEAMATMVLQEILGGQSKVKYGGANGILSKAVASISGSHSVSAINFAYSDVALLGAFIASDSGSAGAALEAVIASLRSANVTEDQLLTAKKSLQVSLQSQTSGQMLETLGSSILFGSKEGLTPGQVVAACNNVTLSDVMAVAKKLSNAKFSMGAAGNLRNVGFIDEL